MDVLSAYKYLPQVYPADFINSLGQSKDGESVLQSILTSTQAPARELWRQHLEACLAVADKHHLLEDSAFLSRLRCKELRESQAAFSELGAALYFEQAGAEVEFPPPSSTGNSFDFRVAAAGGKVVNAEVKAMLEGSLDELHRRAMRCVRECISRVNLPFDIVVSRVKPDLRFSRKDLRRFLEGQLGKVPNDGQQLPRHFFQLPRYINGSGFRATFWAARNPDAVHARFLTSSRGIWLSDDGARVVRDLKDARSQLPRGKVANLAIVDTTHTMWLHGKEVLSGLYGGDNADRGQRPGEFVLTGRGSGFWGGGKNTRVSGVMLIRWLVLKPTVPQAYVLHNPWALVRIGRTFFPTNAVQFEFCPDTAAVSCDPAARRELWF